MILTLYEYLCILRSSADPDAFQSGQYHKIASGVNGKGCRLRYKRTIDAKIYLL